MLQIYAVFVSDVICINSAELDKYMLENTSTGSCRGLLFMNIKSTHIIMYTIYISVTSNVEFLQQVDLRPKFLKIVIKLRVSR